MNFDSGWEWGYWLNDVVTARASWDPFITVDNNWEAFKLSLHPFLSIYPKDISVKLEEILISLAKSQEELFVYGNVTYWYADTNTEDETRTEGLQNSLCDEGSDEASMCKNIDASSSDVVTKNTTTTTSVSMHGGITKITKHSVICINTINPVSSNTTTDCRTTDSVTTSSKSNKLSGLAYIEGDDTWIDLPRLLGLKKLLQPDKIHLNEVGDVNWRHAIALLEAMKNAVEPLQRDMQELLWHANNLSKHKSMVNNRKESNKHIHFHSSDHIGLTQDSLDLLHEIFDSITMLLLRIKQVRMLYLSRDSGGSTNVKFNTIDNIDSASTQLLQTQSKHENAAELLTQSRNVIHIANIIVAERETKYRVNWNRIAGTYKLKYCLVWHGLQQCFVTTENVCSMEREPHCVQIRLFMVCS